MFLDHTLVRLFDPEAEVSLRRFYPASGSTETSPSMTRTRHPLAHEPDFPIFNFSWGGPAPVEYQCASWMEYRARLAHGAQTPKTSKLRLLGVYITESMSSMDRQLEGSSGSYDGIHQA